MQVFESLIALIMKRQSLREVISFYQNGRVVETLNFEQLFKRSLKRVEELRKIKISPKSMILVEGSNNANFLVNFFAIHLLNCTPVPVSPGHFLSAKRFSEMIQSLVQQTGAEVFLSNPTDRQTYQSLINSELLIIDQSSFSQAELSELEDIYFPHSSDIAFIQFSSGSTGDPKGVVITHENLMSNLEQISTGLAAREDDRAVTWLPVHHDMGLIGCVLFPLYAQIPLHVMKPFDFAINPKRWLKLISDKKITLTCAPNSAFHMCTTKIKRREDLDLSSLRVAMCGAEPINAKTLTQFIEAFKSCGLKETVFMPCYGMAENVLGISFAKPEEKIRIIYIDKYELTQNSRVEMVEKEQGLAFVSCGRPLSGVEIKILDGDNLELGEMAIGEILIKSKSTTSGYYQRQDLNTKLFHQGFLRTGDLGFIHQGELYIAGRSKDLIIINGLNLYPEEIEKQILEVREVRGGRLAAFAIPNKEQSSEEIHVVLEIKGNHFSRKKRELLKEKISQVASELLVIKSHQITILPAGSIKKTTSGKIKRGAMREMYLRGEASSLERNYEFHSAKNLVKNKFLSVKFFLENLDNDKVEIH